jgi:hypothetical protein
LSSGNFPFSPPHFGVMFYWDNSWSQVQIIFQKKSPLKAGLDLSSN